LLHGDNIASLGSGHENILRFSNKIEKKGRRSVGIRC